MGQSNGGFTANADGGATGQFDAKDEPHPNVGQRLGSVLMNQFPMAGAVGQGLYHQVFGQGQSPQAPSVQEGVGPPIVGIHQGSVDPEQAKGGGLGMKILKALVMG